VSKARLIYCLVFAILIASALLPAVMRSRVFPDGPHDGAQV
jgi:hypothetical protein